MSWPKWHAWGSTLKKSTSSRAPWRPPGFLAQQAPGGTAFVIGEGGLLTALHQNGFAIVDHDPDYVVVGEGRTFNLELVETAVRLIQGAPS